MQKTTCDRNGTITYWSVYEQVWIRNTEEISDRELAAMESTERDRVIKHLRLDEVEQCQ